MSEKFSLLYYTSNVMMMMMTMIMTTSSTTTKTFDGMCESLTGNIHKKST